MVKEPLIERKISQLRDGSLRRKLGRPVVESVEYRASGVGEELPIMRKTGFCTGLGEGFGVVFGNLDVEPSLAASADTGFDASVMV